MRGVLRRRALIPVATEPLVPLPLDGAGHYTGINASADSFAQASDNRQPPATSVGEK